VTRQGTILNTNAWRIKIRNSRRVQNSEDVGEEAAKRKMARGWTISKLLLPFGGLCFFSCTVGYDWEEDGQEKGVRSKNNATNWKLRE
jgi:hypothetical protein